MAKYRMVRTDFWKNPVVSEEMTVEDKYFLLYLLTNHQTTQIGIYKITKREIAFDMGYSIDTIHSLMDRFIHHHNIIRYNPDTRELAIKNWGKYNLHKSGKPVIDCILSELKEVEDTSLIAYVATTIGKGDIQAIYHSFIEKEEALFEEEEVSVDTDVELNVGRASIDEDLESPIQVDQKKEAAKEILECWDQNGFGISNRNAKEKLLDWLEDSSFLNPKEVILKAMQIGCANNKRRLNYVVGILKNWENESILTVEEIDLYSENKWNGMRLQSGKSFPAGRDIPRGDFVLDLTAGEEG